nr:NADH dehydrogenase subunit 4 [Tachinomorphus sp. 1 FYJ-2024a]
MMSILMFMLFTIPMIFFSDFWLLQICFMLMFIFFMKFISFNYMILNLSYMFGCDLLSFVMVLLSIWICMLMLLASYKIYKLNNFYNLLSLSILFLLISLFLTFSSINLLVFYIFFEMSLIPTMLLIFGWGYQPERIQAGVYLLFYTLLASLPMMISLFYYYNNFNSLNLFMMSSQLNLFMYMCMNFVFFVKLPMYFIHLWLPKAHVEAPVSGSMILAGVMLKLGGYGLSRLLILFMKISFKINFIFIVVSLIGGIYVSLVCLVQSDIKSLIAYSSVAHMGMVLGGLMTMNFYGLCGALVMMLAHGLCSSGLFCLANLSYERIMSRSLFLNKGMISILPSLSLWWFLLSSSNMAAPPSLNLLGEIYLINSLVMFSGLSMLPLSLISFLSACYSLYLYSYTQHGKFFPGLYSFSMVNLREFLLMFLHWFPLNLLILKSELFLLWI